MMKAFAGLLHILQCICLEQSVKVFCVFFPSHFHKIYTRVLKLLIHTHVLTESCI